MKEPNNAAEENTSAEFIALRKSSGCRRAQDISDTIIAKLIEKKIAIITFGKLSALL